MHIQNSKQKALQQVNSTFIVLYWNISKYISTKVKQKIWGKSVVDELANFIKEKEPSTKGFTARNIWMMKQFYETYNDNQKLYTVCAVLSWSHNRRILALKTYEE